MFYDNLDQIEKLVKMVSESDIGELSVKEGDLKITVRKKSRQCTRHGENGIPPVPPMPPMPPVYMSSGTAASNAGMPIGYDMRIQPQPYMGMPQQMSNAAGVFMTESGVMPGQNMTAEKEEQVAEGNKVESPLVGTFYAASSPDAEPFVKKGDVVKKGQVLGIVEAMKLMNEIECEFDGVVADILVENGAMVEYGQPLFVIK